MAEIQVGELHTADRDSFFRDTTTDLIYRRVRDTQAADLLTQILASQSAAAVVAVNVIATASSVASGSETAILTYTVPAGQSLTIDRVDVSGQNIGTYNIYADGVLIARKRTYFAGPLSEVADFSSEIKSPAYPAGSVLEVRVIHTRPSAADFEARLQGGLA